MNRVRSIRHSVAGVLVAAFLLQLIAPAIGSWISGTDQSIEICTAAGIKRIDPAQLDGNRQPADKHTLDHCALCSITGAAEAFDAKRYLLLVPGQVSPQTSVSEAPTRVFPGHEILSRAPPFSNL